MKSRKTAAVLLAMVLAMTGCSKKESSYVPEEQPETSADPEPVKTWAEEKLESMTLQEKIGQMIMVAMRYWSDEPIERDERGEKTVLDAESEIPAVTSLNTELADMIRDLNLGGVCLFGANFESTEQVVRLTDELQKAAQSSSSELGMLIAADQEGGYVTRLTTGTAMPGNMALAATGYMYNAKKASQIIGEELHAAGINVNFGPDLDVNNNPSNPVIGIRSFSDDPDLTAECGAAYISGLHESGTAACVKHYPGHGDTGTDSHTGFPMVEKSYEEISALELVPFGRNAQSTDLVMTAHIQYPLIETETYTSITTGEEVYLPATMSRTIISDLLRGTQGFNGVVITDALEMDAISKNFDPMDAAKMAINADVDILLMPVDIIDRNDIERLRSYISGIEDMVESGEIAMEEIDDSVMRILKLKEQYGIHEVQHQEIEEKVSHALDVIGSKEHHDAEWQIALDGITAYKEDKDIVPLGDYSNVLYLCANDSMLLSGEYAEKKLREDGVISDTVSFDYYSYAGKEAWEFYEDAEWADVIVIVSRTYSLDTLNPYYMAASLIREITEYAHELGKKVILISSHLPYDAVYYSDADSIYLAYNPAGMTRIPDEYDGHTVQYGVNIPAAVYTALGGSEAQGVCPVVIDEDLIRQLIE